MDKHLRGVWIFVVMLFFLVALTTPINATKMTSTTENDLIDVIVAYSNVDQGILNGKGLTYSDFLEYSTDDMVYFKGLIDQLMKCYSKSTSDFTIDDQISKRIFYFGFTNAKMDDYYSGESTSLSFSDIVGTKEVKEYLEGYEGQDWAKSGTKLESDFPFDRTLSRDPKVCTFAFLIFEDLSFSIVAFYNCDGDPLKKPFTPSEYTLVNKDINGFKSDLDGGRIQAISGLSDNKKKLASLASKIRIYLGQALKRKDSDVKLYLTCSDFLKDSSAVQPPQSEQTTDSTNNNNNNNINAGCNPETDPCCNEDGTLKGNGEPCDNPNSYWKCDKGLCSMRREKSACEDGVCKIQSGSLETKFVPEGYICNVNSDDDSLFVPANSENYCGKVDTCSNGVQPNRLLTEYYGCDGYSNCGSLQTYDLKQTCTGDLPNCCNGKCVNYQNGLLNCGGCGITCNQGEFCTEGGCEKISTYTYCISIKGEKFCPEHCENNVHSHNGVCDSDNVCKYDSEPADCCSNDDCVGRGSNFKCVEYECACTPFSDSVLKDKCSMSGFDCGTIDDGCGDPFDCGVCDDGKECLEGKCVAVDSQEEGDSVVDENQQDDLDEIGDDKESPSQPSETCKDEIEFGAITKNPPTFCRELGGNIFASFVPKRYNWYKDTQCPTEEYSYYSLAAEQSRLIYYHCRDTCGGSSCGCNFGFGCEGCMENDDIILDCSNVKDSDCNTLDETGKYVNQCNPQCVKAIDCRSGDSKVITGIDNTEEYKQLGCSYEPKGTSCTGENWMDGTCDGKGKCIVFECTKDEECGNGLICVNRKCFADISVDLSIMGTAYCTAEQMSEYLLSKKRNVLLFESNEFFKDLDESEGVLNLANYYIESGNVEGVRGDLAFAQSILETGWFNFEGSSVSPTQNNFAGIGATGGGVSGHSFSTPREGVLAQIQHLKAYASNEELKSDLVDPRYNYVNPKGVAPTLKDLQGRWASGSDYAEKIVQIYQEMVTTQCKS